jgi:mannan endo-1,4-beta-mannosidase
MRTKLHAPLFLPLLLAAAQACGGDDANSSTGAGGTSASGGAAAETFTVRARHLYDRCGEQVVLRGVNEMVVWSPDRDESPEFGEIAKTGANAVRIVWNEEGTAAQLDTAISNAVAHELIPMVEHHSATGDLSKVPEVVDWWVQPEVVAVLKKHEPHLLLNIANEAGDGSVTQEAFLSTYRTAIDRLRATGLVLPLVIDAPQWGQNIDMLQSTGPTLIEHDPEHNLLFSVHMWWHDPDGARVQSEIAQSVEMNLPLIVGEFSQHAVYLCDEAPFAYSVLLEEAEAHQIGWLAWSWGSVTNNDCQGQGGFDMTTDGTYGHWNAWGEDVAVTDPNSIQNTSVRPASMVNGACE